MGGDQTLRPRRGQKGLVVLTCGAGLGPRLWRLRGWSTAVQGPLVSGNWQQRRLTVGCGRSTCPTAWTWPTSRLQPAVSSCCCVTGTRTCSSTCCATAPQTCEGHPLLCLAPPPNQLKVTATQSRPLGAGKGWAGDSLSPLLLIPSTEASCHHKKCLPVLSLVLPTPCPFLFELCAVAAEGERATAPRSYAIKCLLGLS